MCADALVEKRSGPRLTKAENHAIVRELYPHIPGTTRDKRLLGPSAPAARPLMRIGGCKMPWEPPSAWFNGSLDGEMCDWKVETK